MSLDMSVSHVALRKKSENPRSGPQTINDCLQPAPRIFRGVVIIMAPVCPVAKKCVLNNKNNFSSWFWTQGSPSKY